MLIPSLNLGYSKSLTVYLLIAHSASIFLLLFMAFQSTLSSSAAIVLIITCVFMLFHTLGYHAFRTKPNAIVGLHWHSDHSCWVLKQQNGNQYTVDQIPGYVMTTFLILLYFKSEGSRKRKSLIILFDAVNEQEWRRLRAFLRFN